MEEVVGNTVAARAAGAMVRIFACPRRVAFQAYADEPALLVCGSVARLSEPGPCSRVGKAEVPFDSLLARCHCTGCGAHISRAVGPKKLGAHPFGAAAGAFSDVMWGVKNDFPSRGVTFVWVWCPIRGLCGSVVETVLLSPWLGIWICVCLVADDRCDLCHHS